MICIINILLNEEKILHVAKLVHYVFRSVADNKDRIKSYSEDQVFEQRNCVSNFGH